MHLHDKQVKEKDKGLTQYFEFELNLVKMPGECSMTAVVVRDITSILKA